MPATRAEILEAALQLSDDDRLVIASELLETLPPDSLALSINDPRLTAELKRRSGDLEGSIPWDQLRDELRGGS